MNADVQGLLTLGLTGVLAITSIGMMVANVYLARETSLQRKAGTEPDVVGYLLPDESSIHVLQFHLKNVGHGTAVRLSFEVLGDAVELGKKGVRLPLTSNRPPISILPQGEGLRLFFGVAHQLLKEPCPVTVRISYENVKGGRTSKDIVLDVKQFEGFSIGLKSPEAAIADALGGIAQQLRHWSTGFQKVGVVAATPDEWRAEAEREEREWRQDECASEVGQDAKAE